MVINTLSGTDSSGNPHTLNRKGFHVSITRLATLKSSLTSPQLSTNISLWWHIVEGPNSALCLTPRPHMAAMILYSFSSKPKTAASVPSFVATLNCTVTPHPLRRPVAVFATSWCIPAINGRSFAENSISPHHWTSPLQHLQPLLFWANGSTSLNLTACTICLELNLTVLISCRIISWSFNLSCSAASSCVKFPRHHWITSLLISPTGCPLFAASPISSLILPEISPIVPILKQEEITSWVPLTWLSRSSRLRPVPLTPGVLLDHLPHLLRAKELCINPNLSSRVQ